MKRMMPDDDENDAVLFRWEPDDLAALESVTREARQDARIDAKRDTAKLTGPPGF